MSALEAPPLREHTETAAEDIVYRCRRSGLSGKEVEEKEERSRVCAAGQQAEEEEDRVSRGGGGIWVSLPRQPPGF
jgi:hypothetical protein